VKVCGITNLDNALMCENYGANALGFIFYKESKRYISPDDAKNIIKNLSPFTIKVGVFVNESAENINRISSETKLDLVQLHGDENPALLKEIELPAIKSFRVKDNFDFSTLNDYKNCSHLLDTYTSNGFGGSGKIFNWNIIPKNILNKIILSGGVSINNIETIYNDIKPSAVDLSSSLEIEPGKKDEQKVKEFFNKIYSLRSKTW
jgi:phosphoribosylanthranilate isomerase